MKVEYLNYNHIERMVDEILDSHFFELDDIDFVVGTGRAGAILGGMIATKLDKNFIYYDPKLGDFFPDLLEKNSNILIVDDVIATGKTIVSAYNLFKNVTKGKIYVFALYLDVSRVDDEYKKWLVNNENIWAWRVDGSIWYLFPWDLIDYVKGERKSYSRDRL